MYLMMSMDCAGYSDSSLTTSNGTAVLGWLVSGSMAIASSYWFVKQRCNI